MQKKLYVKIFLSVFLAFFSQVLLGNDSLKILKNDQLIEKFQKELNPTNCIHYFKELQTRKLPPEIESKINYKAGVMYDFLMDNKTAEIYLKKSYDAHLKSNDKEALSSVTYYLAVCEYKLGNFNASEKYFEEFKKLVDALPEGMKKISQQADYYTIYLLNGDFEKFIKVTEENYRRTLLQEEVNTNPQLKPAFLITKLLFSDLLLNAAVLKRDEKLAETYHKRSEDLFENNTDAFKQFGNGPQIGFHYLFKSQYFIFKKDFVKADQEISRLKKFSEANGFKDFRFKALVTKANLEFKKGNFSESYQNALEALKNKVPIIDFYNYELEAYRYAYLSAKSLGKTEEALKYSQLFMEKSDQTINEKKQKSLDKILTKEENFYTEKNLEKEKRNKSFSMVGLILSGILVMGLIAIVFRNKRKYRRDYLRFQEIIKEISEKKEISKSTDDKKDIKPQSYLDADEKTKNLLTKLAQFENGSEFLKQEMSLSYLAGLLNTNSVTMSSVINNFKDSNFNDYINRLRINFIIDRLRNDSEFPKYKISYLAEISGFSSHTLFTIAFKKVTGITPTQFIKFIREIK